MVLSAGQAHQSLQPRRSTDYLFCVTRLEKLANDTGGTRLSRIPCFKTAYDPAAIITKRFERLLYAPPLCLNGEVGALVGLVYSWIRVFVVGTNIPTRRGSSGGMYEVLGTSFSSR